MAHTGTCEVCGKTYTRPRPLRGSTCSRECSDKKRQRRITKLCPVCGTSFTRTRSYESNYCSIRCFNNRGRRKPDMTRTCVQCGKDYERWPGQTNRRFCSVACGAAHRTKTKNKQLMLRMFTRRNSRQSASKAVAAFKRSYPYCQRCGWKEEPAILHVHHRDRNRRNFSSKNLESLCPTCHVLEHYRAKDGIWRKIAQQSP